MCTELERGPRQGDGDPAPRLCDEHEHHYHMHNPTQRQPSHHDGHPPQ